MFYTLCNALTASRAPALTTFSEHAHLSNVFIRKENPRYILRTHTSFLRSPRFTRRSDGAHGERDNVFPYSSSSSYSREQIFASLSTYICLLASRNIRTFLPIPAGGVASLSPFINSPLDDNVSSAWRRRVRAKLKKNIGGERKKKHLFCIEFLVWRCDYL